MNHSIAIGRRDVAMLSAGVLEADSHPGRPVPHLLRQMRRPQAPFSVSVALAYDGWGYAIQRGAAFHIADVPAIVPIGGALR
jgi:hypothetical protein